LSQRSQSSATRLEAARIGLLGWLGYVAIALVGRTVRWEDEGRDHLEAIRARGARTIFTFWHGRIFPATWYWRRRGIVVMTSLNYDGEIIARCIRRHGYDVARGSSSNAGFRALAEMVRAIRDGQDVAFTIDGPRGPRYIAKQGPVILARKTGAAILCFHIGLRRCIQLNSWDRFQIPLPFTRARVFIAPPIWIESAADEDRVRAVHARMQQVLDDLRIRGDHWAASRGL
jgi:lysophospholipid acyltransferase (LPLAT)-like uncharacterized protein